MGGKAHGAAVGQLWKQNSYGSRGELLPQALDAINSEWLTRTLQVRFPELVVKNLRLVDVINTHTTKVRVAYEVNEWGRSVGFPESACLKANWSGSPLSSGSGICALEAKFYRYLRDRLPVPAPVGYFADWDEDSFGQGFVMMEDLVDAGVKFGSACRPIGFEEARQSLDELAALHAGLWNSEELERHRWLTHSMGVENSDPELYRTLEPYMREGMRQERRRAVLPAWLVENPGRFAAVYDKLVAYERGRSGAICLLHGDAHLGNTYVTRTGRRRWLDWQIVRKGAPWRDVSYFLISAIPVETRRKHEIALVEHYLECLARRDVAVPSFDEAWREYCLWPIHGLASFNGSLDAWQEAGAIQAGVERFSAAIQDLDSVARLEAAGQFGNR